MALWSFWSSFSKFVRGNQDQRNLFFAVTISVTAAVLIVWRRNTCLAHGESIAKPAIPKKRKQNTGTETCPGCGSYPPELRKHMKRCCPELLPERQEVKHEERLARQEASEGDWIDDEEVAACAVESFAMVSDPLQRRALELRFGVDRGGGRRTPVEVAEALGGKYKNNPQAALNLIRNGLRSIPLVADDPRDLIVLYDDGALLAVSKPPFLRSTPVHRFVGKSLTNQLVGYAKQQADKNTTLQDELVNDDAVAPRSDGKPRPPLSRQTAPPLLLHRLDQNTSGVVLCAKTKDAASFLQDIWHGPECKKDYLALAWKNPAGSQLQVVGDIFVMKAPIGRDVNSSDPVRRAVNFEEGQTATTQFQLLALGGSSEELMLVACTLLESGRTHQIRVHAAHAGFPLLGDVMYGGSLEGEVALRRAALHAWRLRTLHPTTKASLVIKAPLPDDFLSCMAMHGLSCADALLDAGLPD